MHERDQLEKNLGILEKEIKSLNDRLQSLESHREAILIRLTELEYGLKIGQNITYRGLTGRLEKFESFWPVMRPHKKDGTLSTRLVHCYNFYDDNKI